MINSTSFFKSEDYNTGRENNFNNNFFGLDLSGIPMSPIGTNLNNESESDHQYDNNDTNIYFLNNSNNINNNEHNNVNSNENHSNNNFEGNQEVGNNLVIEIVQSIDPINHNHLNANPNQTNRNENYLFESPGLNLDEDEPEKEDKGKKKNKKKGRKKKDDSLTKIHDKYSNDNIIRKIKGYFFNTFIIDFIQKNSLSNDIIFKKIPSKFLYILKKKTNLDLYKKKISNILSSKKISKKYSTFKRDENKKIISKIKKEKIEKKVIKILDLTFKELFIIFRRKLEDENDKKKLEKIKKEIEGVDLDEDKENHRYKDIMCFVGNIKTKMNLPDDADDDEYIKKIKERTLEYEKWFKKKVPRNKKNNNS